MIEDELRAVFAQHEDLTPDPVELRGEIDRGIQRSRRRRRRMAQLTGAAALVVAIAAVPATMHLIGSGSLARPGDGSSSTSAAARSGPLNLLVLGVDRRQGSQEPARADAIMIAHLPSGRDPAYLVSVPRDTFVAVPDHGRDKINAAYAYGGEKLMTQVLENLTGVNFDGVLTIDFAGLAKLTNAVGGVRMCPKAPVRSYHTGHNFPVGCQQVTGDQALDLVRQRISLPNGDLDRVDNEQEYVRALFDRLTDLKVLADPTRTAEIVAAAGETLKLDLGELTGPALLGLIRNLTPRDLVGITLPVADTSSPSSGYQIADPAASELFTALWRDQVESWVAAHPGAARPR
jgi:LCP family protein required for cell wall assembly